MLPKRWNSIFYQLQCTADKFGNAICSKMFLFITKKMFHYDIFSQHIKFIRAKKVRKWRSNNEKRWNRVYVCSVQLVNVKIRLWLLLNFPPEFVGQLLEWKKVLTHLFNNNKPVYLIVKYCLSESNIFQITNDSVALYRPQKSFCRDVYTQLEA